MRKGEEVWYYYLFIRKFIRENFETWYTCTVLSMVVEGEAKDQTKEKILVTNNILFVFHHQLKPPSHNEQEE